MDESGAANTTVYERDAIGRVTKVAYPDGTSEQTFYEELTGMVEKTQDRAGQWVLRLLHDLEAECIIASRKVGAIGPFDFRSDAPGCLETAVREDDRYSGCSAFTLRTRPPWPCRSYRALRDVLLALCQVLDHVPQFFVRLAQVIDDESRATDDAAVNRRVAGGDFEAFLVQPGPHRFEILGSFADRFAQHFERLLDCWRLFAGVHTTTCIKTCAAL